MEERAAKTEVPRMHYKLLGKSGLRVSEITLGTMTFGEDWGWGASRDESKKIFDAYLGAQEAISLTQR